MDGDWLEVFRQKVHGLATEELASLSMLLHRQATDVLEELRLCGEERYARRHQTPTEHQTAQRVFGDTKRPLADGNGFPG